MKFKIEQVYGIPFAVFENEDSTKANLLSQFLSEARTGIEPFLREIEKAKHGEKIPTGYTCNSVDVEFFPDRAVIEELYPASGDENDAQNIEITLDDAKELLINWQKALEEWNNGYPS